MNEVWMNKNMNSEMYIITRKKMRREEQEVLKEI